MLTHVNSHTLTHIKHIHSHTHTHSPLHTRAHAHTYTPEHAITLYRSSIFYIFTSNISTNFHDEDCIFFAIMICNSRAFCWLSSDAPREKGKTKRAFTQATMTTAQRILPCFEGCTNSLYSLYSFFTPCIHLFILCIHLVILCVHLFTLCIHLLILCIHLFMLGIHLFILCIHLFTLSIHLFILCIQCIHELY